MTPTKCLSCGVEMGADWPGFSVRLGRICMGCEGEQVDAFALTINGSTMYDADVSSLLTAIESEISSMDDSDCFTVRKCRMLALKYYNLPEHGGF